MDQNIFSYVNMHGSGDEDGLIPSLVPRPSLTAFFTAVAKTTLFATAAKKAVKEGPGTRLPHTRVLL